MSKKNNKKPILTIDELYSILRRNSNPSLTAYHVPHSVVFTTRVLIKEKFNIDLGLEEVERILYIEGLLPPQAYKIPKWYIDKYMPKFKYKDKSLSKFVFELGKKLDLEYING